MLLYIAKGEKMGDEEGAPLGEEGAPLGGESVPNGS
jgi:hypothetical protein